MIPHNKRKHRTTTSTTPTTSTAAHNTTSHQTEDSTPQAEHGNIILSQHEKKKNLYGTYLDANTTSCS